MRLPGDVAGRGQAVVLLHARPADRTMWRAVLLLGFLRKATRALATARHERG